MLAKALLKVIITSVHSDLACDPIGTKLGASGDLYTVCQLPYLPVPDVFSRLVTSFSGRVFPT